MTNWKAVGVGLVVSLFIGFVGIVVPGIGQLVAGLVGGLVAGYIASTSIRGGLWHGLLAGSIGGVLFAVPFGIIIGVASFGLGLTNQLGSLAAGIGVFIFTIIAAVVLGADSAIGGAMGAIIKRKYPNLGDRRHHYRRSQDRWKSQTQSRSRTTTNNSVVRVESPSNQSSPESEVADKNREK